MADLYNHDAERAVIQFVADASTLDIPRARVLADQAQLAAADFHLPLHADVWTTALGLLREGHPADLLTVCTRLPRADRNAVMAALIQPVPSSEEALMAHAATVRELALRRKAVAVAEAVRAAAVDRDKPIDTVLSTGSTGWADLSRVSTTTKSGQEVLMGELDAMERAARGESVRCIPTGIDVWDQVFGGVTVGELTFIGSQPSVGKSSLMGTMIANLCDREVPCALMSLEDKAGWLPRRLLARAAAVPLFYLSKRPDLLTQEHQRRIGETSQSVYNSLAFLHVDERSLLTAPQVVQSARAMVLQYGCRVVFIDHLGKIDHSYRSFDRPDIAIGNTLTHLVALAKEMGVAVVIAAHLTRGEGSGSDDPRTRRPKLTDFAGAAAIERDARTAVGLFWDKDDEDALLVAMLKQTEGKSQDVFAIRRAKECALVCSRNGRLPQSYADDERRLMAARGDA